MYNIHIQNAVGLMFGKLSTSFQGISVSSKHTISAISANHNSSHSVFFCYTTLKKQLLNLIVLSKHTSTIVFLLTVIYSSLMKPIMMIFEHEIEQLLPHPRYNVKGSVCICMFKLRCTPFVIHLHL
jgi:hypothetical protein